MTKAEQILKENGWEVGDMVVRGDKEVGVITDICKCDQCEERGFYELVVDWYKRYQTEDVYELCVEEINKFLD